MLRKRALHPNDAGEHQLGHGDHDVDGAGAGRGNAGHNPVGPLFAGRRALPIVDRRQESQVKIWDLSNHGGDRQAVLIQDRVERCIASVDRTGFATRNDQDMVQFWDSASLEALPTPVLPPGEIWSLNLRGDFAVIGSNRVQLVNLRDGKNLIVHDIGRQSV